MEDHKEGRVEPEYTMQVVVTRTGVPADTIRSWERRHGFPRPRRDGTNQRVYAESDIHAIRMLSELRALGWSMPEAILHLKSPTIAAPTKTHAVLPSARGRTQLPPPRRSSMPRSSDELATLLDDFEGETVGRFLTDTLALSSVEDVCFGLLLPLATQAGAEGQIHPFRTSFVRRLFFTLYNASSPDSGRSTILLVGVPGTRNESHLLCHAICISRAGYRTVLLGTNVPLNHAEHAIETIRPQAVMMAADTENSAWTLARWSHRLNVERPIDGWHGALLFSGPIFSTKPDLASDVVAAQVPDHPDEARAVLERVLGNPNPSLHIVRET